MRRNVTIYKVACLLLLVFGAGYTLIAQETSRAPHNVAEFDELFQRVSNWGRWGADDQLGSVNLITPAKRKQAAALVKEGITVPLGHDYLTEAADDVPSPFEYTMNPSPARDPAAPVPLMSSVADTIKVSYHGFTHSHIDGLCHILYKDQGYNGIPRSEIVNPIGCQKLGVDKIKGGIVTRGILLDIPRLKGLPYLEPGTAIYAEDLEAWEKMAHIKIEPGDAIFLRTGRWARRDKLGPWNVSKAEAGVHSSAAPWIKSRGVAIIGSDDGFDVIPSGVEGVMLPWHMLSLDALGINLMHDQDLEALAATAARLNRWEFMLTVGPLAITKGSGSPVNALAIF